MYEFYIAIVTAPLVWIAAGLLAVLGLLTLIQPADVKPRVVPWLSRPGAGLTLLKWLSLVLLPLWLLMVALLAIATLRLWQSYPPSGAAIADIRYQSSLLLANAAAIGGLFTLFFAVIRVFTTERQTRTAEEQARHNALVLLNGRTQAALAQLSARVRITRIGRSVHHDAQGGRDALLQWHLQTPEMPAGLVKAQAEHWQVFDLEDDDVQTRLSAIGQLAAIIQEVPEQRRAINEHLANYIRANSPADRAQEHNLAEPADDAPGPAWREWAEKVQTWARGLAPRADIQAAVALIGAAAEEDANRALDLRNTNLQGVELPNANLAGALMQGARMQGANLFEARMQGANLYKARMQGATLVQARMQGATLFQARMQGATLYKARMQRATLYKARLQGADLSLARMQGTDLRGARMQGATLYEARLQGTDLGWARMQGTDLRGARMEGTDLSLARMQGAYLWGARVDASTDFSRATLEGAGLKQVDFTMLRLDPKIFQQAFGDATVRLPDGITLHPDAPVDRALEPREWLDAWRAWQRAHGYEPPAR